MLRSLLNRIFRERGTAPASWLGQVAALQQSGRYAEAARVCQARLERFPDDSDALQAFAAAALALGKTAEGVSALEKAATVSPDDPRIHALLGRVFSAAGEVEAAVRSYARAHALDPAGVKLATYLAELLHALGRYEEAEDCCRATLAATDAAAVRHALARAIFEQGRVDDAVRELQAVVTADPSIADAHHDLLRTPNYSDRTDPAELFEAHRAWARRYADPLTRAAPGHTNDPDPDRRLRVGYVSPYFRMHAVTFFLESVFEHHDPGALDVTLYSDAQRPDAYSERLKRHARWRDVAGTGDESLAQTLRSDRIDVLVDLSGHTRGHRLNVFARAPAPVQVAWWGYPNTTGMAAMHYRMTDALCDPPGVADALHVERLVRLPIQTSWTPPRDAPEPGPLPALKSGRLTFGSFNSCYKITPTAVALWSRVLGAVPGSNLVLFAIPGERARRHIASEFEAHGIRGDRLELRQRLSHEAFLEAHCGVDIALDTYPYNGMTTTCFSLWMGVPVIALTGATSAARVGLSQLASIGLGHLAPSTADAFVAAAASLASDLPGLARLRATLRDRMLAAPLTDAKACASSLEAAYRTMWRDWCSRIQGMPGR